MGWFAGGLISFGGFCCALLFAWGGFGIGSIVFAGFGLGLVAVGGCVCGVIASGGLAVGLWVPGAGKAISFYSSADVPATLKAFNSMIADTFFQGHLMFILVGLLLP